MENISDSKLLPYGMMNFAVIRRDDYYYVDKFDALFGDLYIGQHPTKDRNSYLVLKLNFSLVSSELHNYLYTYLLNTYDEAELSFSSYEKSEPGYLS